VAVKVIFLTTTGAGTWTVPSDWSNTNTVETIGGGGGGRVAAAGGGGGGGGAYSSRSNITTFTPGSTVVNFSVGAGGAAGVTGGDTWFGATTLAASLVGAKGGVGATAATGAAGGLNTSGFPTSGGVRNSGGAGGTGSAGVLTGGGGGGAGGPGGTGGGGGAGDATATGQDSGGGGGSGAGLTTAGGVGGPGGTGTGAGGTNATGGGTGGTAAASSGAGGSATAATGMWTSTHLPDTTTASVVGAATGGGGGGGGSATGTAGNGADFGGGGGGRGTGTGGTSQAGNGIIIITYTQTLPTIVASATQTTDLPTQTATSTRSTSLGTPATLRTLPTVFRAPENRIRDGGKLGSGTWSKIAGLIFTDNYATTTDPFGRTVPTFRIQTDTDATQGLIQNQVVNSGATATVSFFARSLTGSTQEWSLWQNFAQVFQVTTSWQRISVPLSGYGAVYLHKYNGLGGVNGDIEIYGFQTNLGTVANSYLGSNYPTLGNSVGPELGIGPDDPNAYPNTIYNRNSDLDALSNGDKTTTRTSATGDRINTVKKGIDANRLVYWETRIEGRNVQGWSGRAGFSSPNTGYGYLDAPETVGVDSDGKVWYNNVHWAFVNANGVGDRICFAVDTINRQYWVRVNNNGWTGWTANNPAALTGGLPLEAAPFPFPIFPAWYSNAAGDSGSIYTAKADWLYAPPLGFGEIPVSTTAVTQALGTPATLRTLPTVLVPRYLGEQRYPHVEQYELEQINIYRANPSAFSQGVGFTASAPVRRAADLQGAARAHNMWEITNDIFQHDEEVGIGVTEQVARYGWFNGKAGSYGIFQNHQWFTTSGRTQKQVVDDMMTNYRNSSAHNSNILDVNHREVGSAFTYIADAGGDAGEYQGFTDGWWNTQDFGYWSPDASYLVGVVYDDTNGNSLYDIGEGITGAIVEATDSGSTVRTATTRVGGGYELALPAGVHGIRVSKDSGSTWTTSQNVTIGSVNVKYDKAYAVATAVNATATQTTALPTQTATEIVRVSATATQTTALPTQVGTETVRTSAAAAQTTAVPTQTATGTIPTTVVNATATQTTALPTQAATEVNRVSATATQSTALPTQTATETVRVSATATQSTALPTQTATETVRVSAVAAGAGYPGGDVTSGQVARYNFDAGNANDSVGSFNGVLVGTPVFANGAVSFSSGNIVQINATFGVAGASRAFSVWFKCSAEEGPIVGQSDNGGFGSEASFIPAINSFADGNVSGIFWGGTEVAIKTTGGNYGDNNWHHVVWQYDGTSQRAELFIDGVSKGVTGTFIPNETWWARTYLGYCKTTSGVGNRPNNDVLFAGTIDDFRVYNRALTLTEVQTLAGGTGTTTALPTQTATATAPLTGVNASTGQTTALSTQTGTLQAFVSATTSQFTQPPSAVATSTVAGLTNFAVVSWIEFSGTAALTSATATQTTALPVQTATETVRVSASAAQTTALPVQVGTETIRTAATAAQTTPLPIQVATATLPLSGINYSTGQTTPLPIQTTTATVRVVASATQTTALPTQVATEVNRVSATAAQTTALPTQVGTETVRTSAAAIQTTVAPTQVADLNIPGIVVNGVAAQTTPLPIQTATETVLVSATATQATALPTQTATGTVRVSAAAAQTTATPTQVATETVRVTATAAQTTPAPIQVAAATLPLIGVNFSVGQTTPAPIQTATSTLRVVASAAQTTPVPIQVATETVRVVAAAAQTTALPTQTATLSKLASLIATQATALPTQTATEVNAVSAVAAQTTTLPIQAAGSSSALNATAAQTTTVPVQAAIGVIRVSGVAAQNTALPAQTTSGSIVVTVASVQVTTLPTQLATAVRPKKDVAADQTTALPIQIATGREFITANVAQTTLANIQTSIAKIILRSAATQVTLLPVTDATIQYGVFRRTTFPRTRSVNYIEAVRPGVLVTDERPAVLSEGTRPWVSG
jgi:hypothetical protein